MHHEVVMSADGSLTVRSAAYDVTYHSIHGAVTESRHVFLHSGLEYVLQAGADAIDILEVGFGTGLNALLTLEYLQNHPIASTYTALEPEPLDWEFVDRLDYPRIIDAVPLQSAFRQMHEDHALSYPLSGDHSFTFSLLPERIQGLALASTHSRTFNLVYYDAFAPGAQPEMWTHETLGIVVGQLRLGGVLVTYCAQGQFKRNLKDLGFRIESISGPPGKREMVRAILES